MSYSRRWSCHQGGLVGAEVFADSRSRTLSAVSGERWSARGGWTIEVVVRHGRPGYRVLQYGHVIAL